ncbi:hypothetical protein O4J56_10310 [Nocardiopsis sp. RSe5-2]|uniref:DUF3592 domain-containing protein n=1 Tax=Nocardiopsis endophytica TaxID=3018445 RepID=A0ABT4U258_9ACTN|nr:DUF3592 domain-containing protein [Nocardiopsis endophytica]MDA2811029.1 hypothetical protein [Nocardiopsis endophytica]
MFTGPVGLALVASLSALIAGTNIVWVQRARNRQRRLLRDGVRSDAEVVAVGDTAPPKQTEHPFTLRFSSPDGTVHRHTFTSGFQGIVPQPGWVVPVVFDPAAPEGAEITDNPYLHPVPGAPAPPRPGRAFTLARYYGPTFLAVLLTVLAVPFAFTEVPPPTVLIGAPFSLMALYVVSRQWLSQRHARPGLWKGPVVPAEAQAVVTDCWLEFGRRGRRWYPFAVEFRLPDGRLFRRGVPTDSAHIESTIGQVRPVVYHPSDPTVVYAGTPESLRRMLSLGSGLSLGVSAFLLALSWGPVLLILAFALVQA